MKSWPAAQRGVHYSEQADKLRAIAMAEPEGKIRSQLLSLVGQYEKLAARLLQSN
jgi:hypothetical protein